MTAALPLSGSELSKPLAPARVLDLVDVVDKASFEALESEWNALVLAQGREPFFRHEYIRSFLDNFLPKAALKVVAGRDALGALVAALPLVSGRGSIAGIGVSELASPTNVHSLRFDLLSADGESADAIFRHLTADASWDVLKITDIPEGGKAWHIYQAAQTAGFPVGAWESQRSPVIELPATHDALMKGLRTKFKANLRRRFKRLGEKGEISFERLSGDGLTESHLEQCLALEGSGWKGRQGSAANQSPQVHGFHLQLLKTEEYKPHLSLFLLKLAGQPIAFHYGLTSGGVYSLVMTSYDESFKEYSPGHLLTEEVLKDCVSRGLREFDFLGCDLPWKLEWTSEVRVHHWLYVFRNNLRGRFLWQLKFGWVRSARKLLEQWRMRLSSGRISS